MGTIGAGQTKAATDPVRVVLDKDIVDETAVEFQLVIKQESVDTWNDKFRKEVHAPVLELTTLRIYDGSPLGNGNGVNEAGEQFRLYYALKNYGTGAATNLTAEINDLDEHVRVLRLDGHVREPGIVRGGGERGRVPHQGDGRERGAPVGDHGDGPLQPGVPRHDRATQSASADGPRVRRESGAGPSGDLVDAQLVAGRGPVQRVPLSDEREGRTRR